MLMNTNTEAVDNDHIDTDGLARGILSETGTRTIHRPPVVNDAHAARLIRQQGMNRSAPNQGFSESKSDQFANLVYECAAYRWVLIH